MSKVFGLHTIALKPGVDAKDFEKFVADAVSSFPPFAGVEFYLLKGDRGDREGRYLWAIEFASIEVRQRHFPAPNEMSPEAQQQMASWAPFFEKWETYATPINVIYTDYVDVSK